MTAALHGGIEAFTEHGHGPRVTVYEAEHTVNTENTTLRQPGAPGMIDHTIVTPGETRTETISSTTFVDGRYARQFATDPNASFVKDEVATSVTADIAKGKAAGLQDILVSVDGLTSGEDRSLEPNAGLQLASKENEDLAAARQQALIQFLVNKGLSSEVAIVSGKLEESNLDDEHLNLVQNAAKNEGFTNVLDLVNAWNGGKTFSTATNELLTKEINNQRGERVTVTGQRIIPGTATTTHEQKRVCIVPTSTVITERVETKPWKATLPYGLIIALGGMVLGTVAEIRRHQRQLSQNKRARSWPDDVPATTLPSTTEVSGSGNGAAYSAPKGNSQSYAPPRDRQTYTSGSNVGAANGAIKPPKVEKSMPVTVPDPDPLTKQERKAIKAATRQYHEEGKALTKELKAQRLAYEKSTEQIDGPRSHDRRRKIGALPWRFILPPLLAVPLLAVGLKARDNNNNVDKPQPPSLNPCAGLEDVERSTGAVSHVKIIDGRETVKY